MTKKVISYQYLPTRLPILPTAVVWLCLDRLQVRPLWQGVVYTILGLLWIAAIVNLFQETQVDPFTGQVQ